MKTWITMASVGLALASQQARADGFVCETVEGDLTIKVYNHTQPSAGTRNGAVMVLSDPAVGHGRKTIARFTDVKSTLANSGATYVADVDLRYADSRRKGELIAGTKLGELDEIVLDVDFRYGENLADGEETGAELRLYKRNGEEILREAVCARYLKN